MGTEWSASTQTVGHISVELGSDISETVLSLLHQGLVC
jgi:hypothetical protein